MYPRFVDPPYHWRDHRATWREVGGAVLLLLLMVVIAAAGELIGATAPALRTGSPVAAAPHRPAGTRPSCLTQPHACTLGLAEGWSASVVIVAIS